MHWRIAMPHPEGVVHWVHRQAGAGSPAITVRGFEMSGKRAWFDPFGTREANSWNRWPDCTARAVAKAQKEVESLNRTTGALCLGAFLGVMALGIVMQDFIEWTLAARNLATLAMIAPLPIYAVITRYRGEMLCSLFTRARAQIAAIADEGERAAAERELYEATRLSRRE